MAFLYGLLRATAAALRLVAAAQHARARQRYEKLHRRFEDVEADCKAHEVRVGRPADYNAQLRLLKAFEAGEKARLKWVRAANRLERRKGRERWLKDVRGKKLPYTFGLVDMALVLHALDHLAPTFGWDTAALIEYARALM